MCGSKTEAEISHEGRTFTHPHDSRPSKLSFFSGKHQEMFNTVFSGSVKDLSERRVPFKFHFSS